MAVSISVTASAAEPNESPREAWILAGTLDGKAAYPPPLEDMGGMPHLLRLACEAAISGAKRVVVVWCGSESPPDVSAFASDPRLSARATIELATHAPHGDARDPILVIRADRIFHRDIPKQAIAAWRTGTAELAKVDGTEHDGVWVTDRMRASRFASRASEQRGMESELAAAEVAVAPVPYLGFTTTATDARSLRSAERRLVWSLRKSADGIAAKLINRHISLVITWFLRRTAVLPNHMTALALASAIVGAVVLSHGGYVAAAVGMLLVDWGSIIDGVDGELARLKFLFSRSGQWFDTLSDDFANLAYSTGVMINLSKAGVGWAMPLWLTAAIGFVLSQSTQYYLIRVVYNSGDLAAIPWAFQSTEFLSHRAESAWERIKTTIPKMLKRDFAVTLFTILAIFGRLDIVLIGYCVGCLSFVLVFFVQLARNFSSLPREKPERS